MIMKWLGGSSRSGRRRSGESAGWRNKTTGGGIFFSMFLFVFLGHVGRGALEDGMVGGWGEGILVGGGSGGGVLVSGGNGGKEVEEITLCDGRLEGVKKK